MDKLRYGVNGQLYIEKESSPQEIVESLNLIDSILEISNEDEEKGIENFVDYVTTSNKKKSKKSTGGN